MNGSVVAIVGRPNVGKSTLFNRLLASHKALTDREPGTTRDRLTGTFSYGKKSWTLVDTGGMVQGEKTPLASQIQKQVRRATEESGLILFVVDVKEGLLPQDGMIADLLRKANRPILLVANKADQKRLGDAANEFYRLGFGDPWAVSALHDLGIQPLKRAIAEKLEGKPAVEEEASIRIAIVGRPNVGKSSFVNALLKEERVIVDDAAGTTRDAIDVPFRKGEQHFLLIDTAGIRREVRIKDVLTLKGVCLSKETIHRCDLCLVLIDATVGLLREDLRILQLVWESKRGLILLVNKWDLLKGQPAGTYETALRRRAPFLRAVPILMTSCVTGKNVLKALDVAAQVHRSFKERLGTPRLNQVLERLRKSARLPGDIRSPFRYMTQTETSPPHFLVFGKEAKDLSPGLIQFLERSLREHLPLLGVPMTFTFKGKEGKPS